MLSVTQRIEKTSQPYKGYVPKSLFNITGFDDGIVVTEVSPTLASIQGLAVDYLTRYILLGDKEKAFSISIRGAQKVDEKRGGHTEYKNIMKLLKGITGLDKKSVICACKAVCYDSVFRVNVNAYKPIDTIKFTEDLFVNVIILVKRTVAFFQEESKIVSDEIAFEGGYTKLVSSGDGDFLTEDAIIDIKVSKKFFSTKWSLQLLMYYLLGIHSIHKEFSKTKKLVIFNPYHNQSLVCNIERISDEVKYRVSHDVLGYKMGSSCFKCDDNFQRYEDYSKWMEVDGSDVNVLNKFLSENNSKTDFDISNYGNGIFDISIDDYWSFLTLFIDDYKNELKPSFKNTVAIKLIKNKQYFMFVSVNAKGSYFLLKGAKPYTLEYPLEYYYERIEEYAQTVLKRFSTYWDFINEISRQIQTLRKTDDCLKGKYESDLKPNGLINYKNTTSQVYTVWRGEKEPMNELSGKIHGCIVDIDMFNHIYVNPFDGTIVPYFALSTSNKDVYKNVSSLLSAKRPDILPAFREANRKIGTNDSQLLVQSEKERDLLPAWIDDSISPEFVKVTDESMYDISNKLKPLQKIYDLNLVQVWYDEIIEQKSLSGEAQYEKKKE